MAGLVPAIHVLLALDALRKTWMPATSAGMTMDGRFDPIGIALELDPEKWERFSEKIMLRQ